MNQAEATFPRPISDALPKDAEVVKTKELVKTLIPFGMFPDDEELRKRERVLKRLEILYKDWLQEMYVRMGVTKYFAKRCRGRIIPYGSYCLGAHVKEAELDVLCVSPTVLKRKHFFTVFFEKLRALREVKDALSIEKKYIPVIKLWFDGIQVNLVLALLPSTKLNDEKDLLDKSILVDLHSECMQSLNGHRVTEAILKSVQSPSNFRLVMRTIKLWAKCRNIYSDRRGFLGGTSWAIMVAKVCQFYPNATASVLVAKFFLVFNAWKWPNPVCLRYPEESISGLPVWDPQNNVSDASHLMPVIKPAYPQENSSVTVSRSSLGVMMDEIKRGRLLTKEIMDGKTEWAKLFEVPDILENYVDFILVEAVAAKDKQHLEWFNIVESKLPSLVTSLEKRSDVSKSHVNAPWCGESENGKCMISKWLIGLEFKEEAENCKKDFSYNIQSFIKSAKSLALYSCYFRKGMDLKAVFRKRDDLRLPQNKSKSSTSSADNPSCSGDGQQQPEETEVEVEAHDPATEEEADSAVSSPLTSSAPHSSKRTASSPTEELTEGPKRCCMSAAGSTSSASGGQSPVEVTSGRTSSDDEITSGANISPSKVATEDADMDHTSANAPFEVEEPVGESQSSFVEDTDVDLSLSEALFGTISSSSSDQEDNAPCFFPDISPDDTSDSKYSSSEESSSEESFVAPLSEPSAPEESNPEVGTNEAEPDTLSCTDRCEETDGVELSPSQTGNFNWNVLSTFPGIPSDLQHQPSSAEGSCSPVEGDDICAVQDATLGEECELQTLSSFTSPSESPSKTTAGMSSTGFTQCIYEAISDSSSDDETDGFRSRPKGTFDGQLTSFGKSLENPLLDTSVWFSQAAVPEMCRNINTFHADPSILLNQSLLGSLSCFTDSEPRFLSGPSCDRTTDGPAIFEDVSPAASLSPPDVVLSTEVTRTAAELTGSSASESFSQVEPDCSRKDDGATESFLPGLPPAEDPQNKSPAQVEHSTVSTLNPEETTLRDVHESLSSQCSSENKGASPVLLSPPQVATSSMNCADSEEAVEGHLETETGLTKRPARPLRRPLGPPIRASPRLKKPNLKFQPSSN